MARPTKPTALKLMKGSLNETRERRRQAARRSPVPEHLKGVPVAPDYLTAEEHAAWRAFGEVLSPLGLSSIHDWASYEGLVTSYVMLQQLRAARRASPDPATVIKLGRAIGPAEKQFVAWLKLWGITPGEISVADVAFASTREAKDRGLNEFAS